MEELLDRIFFYRRTRHQNGSSCSPCWKHHTPKGAQLVLCKANWGKAVGGRRPWMTSTSLCRAHIAEGQEEKKRWRSTRPAATLFEVVDTISRRAQSRCLSARGMSVMLGRFVEVLRTDRASTVINSGMNLTIIAGGYDTQRTPWKTIVADENCRATERMSYTPSFTAAFLTVRRHAIDQLKTKPRIISLSPSRLLNAYIWNDIKRMYIEWHRTLDRYTCRLFEARW